MDNSSLREKLINLRKLHNYTQDYVASALNIARQTYSHYETGKRTPSSEALYKLAGLYDISVEDLMQLVIDLDSNEYYDAPRITESANDINNLLEYINDPANSKKFSNLNGLEKELLYYFDKLTKHDKKEIIEFTKIKTRNL